MSQPVNNCPHCGQPIADRKAAPQDTENSSTPNPDREIDHRGVLLPRRTRMGGIIVPQ